MPAQERQQGFHDTAPQAMTCVCTICIVSYCTWCGEPVLPGWFVVVQSLQHDIHGECKQAGQEDVENYIEEKNQTCRQREVGCIIIDNVFSSIDRIPFVH